MFGGFTALTWDDRVDLSRCPEGNRPKGHLCKKVVIVTSGADTSSFFGTLIPALKFETVGDKIEGRVIDKELRQQTDLDTGELQFWNDGRAKMMAVITILVQEPTEEDDGKRNLFVRGLMQQSFREAVKEAHKPDLMVGDYISVEFTGEQPPTRKGLNGMKEFKVEVEDQSEPPF